jgi:hypothetical protein
MNKWYSFRYACYNNNIKVASFIYYTFEMTIEDVRSYDNFALLWSSYYKNVSIMEFLIYKCGLDETDIHNISKVSIIDNNNTDILYDMIKNKNNLINNSIYDELDDDNKICNICYENINKEDFTLSSCRNSNKNHPHSFHKNCLNLWLEYITNKNENKNNLCLVECPKCRDIIKID